MAQTAQLVAAPSPELGPTAPAAAAEEGDDAQSLISTNTTSSARSLNWPERKTAARSLYDLRIAKEAREDAKYREQSLFVRDVHVEGGIKVCVMPVNTCCRTQQQKRRVAQLA